MKSLFLPVFFCLPFLSPSQITLEQVLSPDDFNMGALRKSSIGEYFIQASNDYNSIYTSMDGIEWNKASLPVYHQLHDIQYFSDGTPLLKSERDEHLIRRNGQWHRMYTGTDEVKASFIKDDTLFMYHDEKFAFSLDTGQSFTTMFAFDSSIIDHTAHLWKLDHHFILHHTAGASDYLSIFDEMGTRVLYASLAISIANITYNSCGQVLINDHHNFYLIQEEGVLYQSGPVANIIPQFTWGSELLSEGGNYYIRTENSIYKTNGCNFAWQFYNANDLVFSKKNIWFSHLGEIYLHDTGEDFYTVETSGTLEDRYPNISHPHVGDVDELMNRDQYAVTSNELFSKKVDHEQWIESDSTGGLDYQVQYSPGGELYVNRITNIIYSTNNGETFRTLQLPPSVDEPFEVEIMEVLGNGILFIFEFGGLGYYTLNYGQEWISTTVSLILKAPKIKLIGDTILIARLDVQYTVFKINISTNDMTSESLGNFSFFYGNGSAILDDGTIYFRGRMGANSSTNGLYRYRYGEDLEFLGPFDELRDYTIGSSGNVLYAFGPKDYYVFDGVAFSGYNVLTGLPQDGSRDYIIAQNEHLYVIVSGRNIFRSTEPLSMTIATNEISDFIDFEIYPNPPNDKLTVTVSESDLHRIDTYEIIDQLGQRIDQSAFENHQKTNVDRLAPGIYNLVLKENGVVVGMKKFVKI